jgi:hypothetical protein
MVILPHMLQGVAIPALASLLSSTSATGKETTSTGKATSANKSSFSDILKSKLDNHQTNGANSADSIKKLEERLKIIAAEINKAAAPEVQKVKDNVTASILNAMTAGNMTSSVNQATALKTEASQTQKLAATNTSPTAQMPAADGYTKLAGENPSVVLITSPDQANNTGLNRYRMENLAMNKKGGVGNNLMVGLRIPIG